MKNHIAIFIVTLFLVVTTLLTFAQPPYNPPNPYTNGNNTGIQGGGLHNSVPIDGGLGILLILATGFGIRKVYKAKKINQKM